MYWVSDNIPCKVRLTYDLSAEGKVANIEPIGEFEACEKLFFTSATKSLANAKFSPETPGSGCFYEYIYVFK